MIIDARITFPPEEPTPSGEMRRVRKWGDPVMIQYDFDYNLIQTSNFQAVRTWNRATGFGAVSNFLYIPHAEVLQIRDMQFPETTDSGFFADQDRKMEWLCSDRGNLYMEAEEWPTAPRIRWGTVALGGNWVQVEGYETVNLSIGGRPSRSYSMARLKGFQPADWARDLDDLLALGLVHRCYCVYRGNGFGDTPKGVIYSPFFSPKHYDFAGTLQPDSLYLPEIWFED